MPRDGKGLDPAQDVVTASEIAARFNDGRLRVTTEAQLRARARFVFTGHRPL